MAYRVVVLSLAAGLSLSSVVLAKEQCLVGEVYFRSKHICAKGTPVARQINHYRPPAAKAHEAVVHRHTRPGKTAAAAHPQTPPREAALPAKVPLPPPRAPRTANSAEIPLPPPRPMRSGAASPPARNAPDGQSASTVPPSPEIEHRSVSPYGELVPVTPVE